MKHDKHMTDSEVIAKYEDLKVRLRPFELHLKSSDDLIVAKDSDPHGPAGCVLYAETIKEVEGFVKALEFLA